MPRRKLPMCAGCGKSLSRRDRTVIELRGIVGQPLFGWHIECESIEHPRGVDMLDRLMSRPAPRRYISAGPGWWKLHIMDEE